MVLSRLGGGGWSLFGSLSPLGPVYTIPKNLLYIYAFFDIDVMNFEVSYYMYDVIRDDH